MASKLTDLLVQASFPLFGVAPGDWDGPAFLGDALSDQGRLRSVSLVYLDQIDGSTMGGSVSNVAAAGGGTSPLETHALSFISRFEPDFLLGRIKRRRFIPFGRDEIVERPVTAAVAGETLGGVLFTHRSLPVQLLRVAKRSVIGLTDLGIVTWRLSAVEFARKVQPIDAAFARAFDLPREQPYPPPEWGPVEPTGG